MCDMSDLTVKKVYIECRRVENSIQDDNTKHFTFIFAINGIHDLKC